MSVCILFQCVPNPYTHHYTIHTLGLYVCMLDTGMVRTSFTYNQMDQLYMQNIWCLAGICSTKLSIKRCLCKRLWLTRLGILMLFFSHCYGSLPLKKLAPSSDFEMYQKSKGSSACVPNGTLLPFFFFFFKGSGPKQCTLKGIGCYLDHIPDDCLLYLTYQDRGL